MAIKHATGSLPPPPAVAGQLADVLRQRLEEAKGDQWPWAVAALLRSLAEFLERGEVRALRLQWSGEHAVEVGLASEGPSVIDAQIHVELYGRVKVAGAGVKC